MRLGLSPHTPDFETETFNFLTFFHVVSVASLLLLACVNYVLLGSVNPASRFRLTGRLTNIRIP